MTNKGITEDNISISLETSGRAGSVALGLGKNLSDEKHFSAPLRHSAELFEKIIDLLKKINKTPADIDFLHISIGPGSFTGLRISTAVAKAMAIAANIKITTPSTSQILVSNINNNSIQKAATIIDAKRGQFFIAVFEKNNGIWQKIMPDCLMKPEDFKANFDKSPIHLLGEGLLYYADNFKTDNIRILDDSYWAGRAGNVFKVGIEMAENGNFADPATLVPLYLRKSDAEESLEKRQNAVT